MTRSKEPSTSRKPYVVVSKYRLQLPSEDDIRKYMLENITEEQFKAMMKEESE